MLTPDQKRTLRDILDDALEGAADNNGGLPPEEQPMNLDWIDEIQTIRDTLEVDGALDLVVKGD